MLNVLVGVATVTGDLRGGQADLGTAIAAGQMLTQAADLAELQNVLKIGRGLKVAGPVMEMTAAAYGVHKQLNYEQQSGQQTQRDSRGWGTVAEVAAGAGGIMLTGGVIASSAPWLVAGLTVVGVAQGALRLLGASNRRREHEADPLYGWLPSGSTWGRQGGAQAGRIRR